MAFRSGALNPKYNHGLSFDGRYIRVNVGRDHPLADSKGFAYLHHLVLAAAGLPVEKGEDRHHRNDDKTDNQLSNLITKDHADHSREHAAGQPRLRGRFANQISATETAIRSIGEGQAA